jgi:Spy/CpxP family protein refolding chaperone
MKKISVLMAMLMVAMLGFGTSAFAGKGKRGNGTGLLNCPAYKSLSAEDQQKVKAEQDAFRTDTKALRDQIKQKHQALKTEMAKAQPDAQAASALQKEISDLKAQAGQKMIQHQLNLKNINPALSDCFKKGKRHQKKDKAAASPVQG